MNTLKMEKKMKMLKIGLVAVLSIFMLSSAVLASEKGSGHEAKGSVHEEKGSAQKAKGSDAVKKGSAAMAVKEEDVAVSGVISFKDYYGTDGKKCAAVLETEDMGTICIIDNALINELRKSLEGNPGHIKAFGKMKHMPDEMIMDVEEVKVDDMKGSSKGSGKGSDKGSSKGSGKGSDHEEKGSMTEHPKGSH